LIWARTDLLNNQIRVKSLSDHLVILKFIAFIIIENLQIMSYWSWIFYRVILYDKFKVWLPNILRLRLLKSKKNVKNLLHLHKGSTNFQFKNFLKFCFWAMVKHGKWLIQLCYTSLHLNTCDSQVVTNSVWSIFFIH
jgi:hypothetical protein